MLIVLLFLGQQLFAEINKDAWYQGLAVVAKHINQVSLKQTKTVKNQQICTQLDQLKIPYNIENIISIIPETYKNNELTKKIQAKFSGAYKNYATKDSAIAYLQNEIFKDELIKDFNKNRTEKEIEEIKTGIREELQSMENWNIPEISQVTDSAANNLNVANVRIASQAPKEDEPQYQNLKTNEKLSFTAFPFFRVIIVMLVLILFASIILYRFVKNELKKRDRKGKERWRDFDYKKVNQEDLDRLNDQINFLAREIETLKAASIYSQTNVEKTIIQKQPVLNPKNLTVKTYYLSAPSPSGIFQNPTAQYISGESIYILKTIDDKAGEFSFVNNPEAFITALTASNIFIQPVCTVSGQRLVEQARAIVTEKPGQVVKEDDYWKVQSKAIIRYE
jgi:hypothetical protein